MSDLRIKSYVVGPVGTNCYLLYRESQKKAVIVDPGAEGALLLDRLRGLSLEPEAILLTHGHFDHIMAVKEILKEFPQVKVWAGEKEKEVLENPDLNLSSGFGEAYTVNADEWVKETDVINILGLSFQVLFTPGHTCGSVCYLLKEEGILLSGDTLFMESLGRTDLPTGDSSQIVESIKDKLFFLPDHTIVYPGHGEPTTMEHEKASNPVAFYRG